MSNENTPQKDHWKDLVESLDLDVEFDDEPRKEEVAPEVSEPSAEEKPQEEAAPGATPPLEEVAPTSKVDPLFDLGWNTPTEPKEVVVEEKKSEPKPLEKPVAEKPKEMPPKKTRRKPESRGFGFGLLPEEELAVEEPEKPMPEPESQPIEPEEPFVEVESEEETTLEVRLDRDAFGLDLGQEESEGASDWIALAAQLGVPIRSESELKEKETSTEEPIVAEEEPEVEEEYDPLAAWGTPAAPRFSKPKEKEQKPSRKPFGAREVQEEESAESEESIMIGKPKDEFDKQKKERRRGRHRGRRQERDMEESVEIIDEEEVVSASIEISLSGEEEELSEERPQKERRRRRRPRKKTQNHCHRV